MADITKDDVIEFIANMSVLDLSELVKEMEEKFGVSAAAAVAAAPAAAGGDAGGAAEEKAAEAAKPKGKEKGRPVAAPAPAPTTSSPVTWRPCSTFATPPR